MTEGPEGLAVERRGRGSKGRPPKQLLKAVVTAIYHENKGRYGYRWITMELHKRGFQLNHKTVQRLMKGLGLICCVRMKKYLSYKGAVDKIAPNLLKRDFYAEKPNQKWVIDGTGFSRKSCVKADKRLSRKEEQIKGLPGQGTARLNRACPPVFPG